MIADRPHAGERLALRLFLCASRPLRTRSFTLSRDPGPNQRGSQRFTGLSTLQTCALLPCFTHMNARLALPPRRLAPLLGALARFGAFSAHTQVPAFPAYAQDLGVAEVGQQ